MIHAIPAHAAILDFESLESASSGNASIGDTYTEKGFTLDDISPTPHNGFEVWGTLHSNYPGSTALYNNNGAGGITRLTQVGNGAFNLTSIDLTAFWTGQSATVAFTGTKADLSTVTQSFTTDSLSTLETFTFNSGFTNLTQVTWSQDFPFHQFDNINVTATSAVPEPLTILGAMTATGFGAIFKRKLAQAKTDKKD